MGPAGPVGLDIVELRARVRAGFDADRVAAIAVAAEGAALAPWIKRREEHA
jgi:hypothetical protein